MLHLFFLSLEALGGSLAAAYSIALSSSIEAASMPLHGTEHISEWAWKQFTAWYLCLLHSLRCLSRHYSSSLCPHLLFILNLLLIFLFSTEAPGQDFVTLDYRLRYYPSITYAVIGSAVIFVLVVALLALVLHHQRKRSVLLPRGVRGSLHHHHQPLLLSRLVILDQGHVHSGGPGLSAGSAAGQYHSNPQALQLLSGTLYPSGLSVDSLPSYSQAVRDVRWKE